MNRQQRRAAGRAGRVTFASLPGWREASAEALRRWAGLFDVADVEGFGAWAPPGLPRETARLDAETIALGALALILRAAGTGMVFARGAERVDLTGEGARQCTDALELFALLYGRTERHPAFAEFAPRWAFIVGELDALARLRGATLREGVRAAREESERAGGDA